MEQKGLRAGHFLALAGALAALVSLWRPWYRAEIPWQLRNLMSEEGARSGGDLGHFVQGIAAALPSSVSASGWEALKGADVALCLGAVAIAALVVGAAGAFGSAIRVDPQAAGCGIAALGAGGLILVVVHAVHRPLSNQHVHASGGLWLALAGCALALAGGLLATAPPPGTREPKPASTKLPPASAFPRLEPELPELFATPAVPASASVPPPS